MTSKRQRSTPRQRIGQPAFVWLEPLTSAALAGQPPKLLDSYTTMVTYALDLALIVPACFVVGNLIIRRSARGYVFAFPLLVLIVMLAPVIAAQTYRQVSAGVSFTPGEMIGPIAGFVTLGLIAIANIRAILRGLGPDAPVVAMQSRPAR